MRIKLIHRYIVNECLWPFLVGVCFLTFVLVIEKLPKLTQFYFEKGVPFWTVVELFVYMLPFTLALTVPMGVLFGVLMGFGRFSSNSEIVAMRASGISMLSIFKPVFYFGTVVTLAMLVFNNTVLPETNHHYKKLFQNALVSNPSIALRDRVFTEIPRTKKKISALNSSRDGQNMSSVFIYEYDNNGDEVKITYADEGHWENNEPNSPIVTLVLSNGVSMGLKNENVEELEYLKFEKFAFNIIQKEKNAANSIRGLREYSAWQIQKQINKKIEKNEIITPKYYIEYHKKFSIPFICIVFVIIAMPLGITLKRSGKEMSLGMAVIIIGIYYGLLAAMEPLGKSGKFEPSLAMWMPNIVLLICGLIVFYKRGKD